MTEQREETQIYKKRYLTQRLETEPFAAQELSHSLKSGNLLGKPAGIGGKECFEWTRSL